MEIYDLEIKNMVCNRCIKVIRQTFEALGVKVIEVTLGRLILQVPNGVLTMPQVKTALEANEFELIGDKENEIIETIKSILCEVVEDLPVIHHKKLSEYLSRKLHKDYWTLSKIFSRIEGQTIEQFFISHRIEKAKNLVEKGNLSFTEIAYDLGYSNIQHLSRQFRQVTGKCMSEYKSQLKSAEMEVISII